MESSGHSLRHPIEMTGALYISIRPPEMSRLFRVDAQPEKDGANKS